MIYWWNEKCSASDTPATNDGSGRVHDANFLVRGRCCRQTVAILNIVQVRRVVILHAIVVVRVTFGCAFVVTMGRTLFVAVRKTVKVVAGSSRGRSSF